MFVVFFSFNHCRVGITNSFKWCSIWYGIIVIHILFQLILWIGALFHRTTNIRNSLFAFQLCTFTTYFLVKKTIKNDLSETGKRKVFINLSFAKFCIFLIYFFNNVCLKFQPQTVWDLSWILLYKLVACLITTRIL